MIKKTPPKYQTTLYEILLYYACKNKNQVHFITLSKEYSELVPFLDEFTIDDKLLRHFVLKRRAKYFANGNYCKEED